MKTKLSRWLVTILSVFLFLGAQAQTTKHRVVFQLASNDTLVHKALLKQLKNVMASFDTIQIEVVCHSNGISLLMKDNARFTAQIKELKDKGVVFDACKNTMKERNLKPEDITPVADFVPSGLGEVIRKEEAGWSYIKAGF